MEFQNIYDKWKSFKSQDTLFKNSLIKIGEQKVFNQSFSSSLSIHNSRIIAKMGANTNHLNEFTIMAIAKSFASFIKDKPNFENKGIIVGHDNRINSELYARTFIHILNKNGVKAFAFKENHPTSIELVPFAIKKMNFEGGINISNSKSSKKINSILFFKKNASLLDKKDEEIIQNNIEATNYLSLNSVSSLKEYKMYFLNEKIENFFIDTFVKEYKDESEKKLNIRISNLHGTSEIFNEILKKIGFNVKEIKSETLNGKKINPWLILKKKSNSSSKPKSLKNVIMNATFNKGNFCIAINPDGSKFSIAVKHKKRFKFLNSSEIAAIYLKYLLEDKKNKNVNTRIFNTIVKSFETSSLIEKIAKKHNLNIIETFSDLNISEEKKVLLAFNEDFGFYDYKSYSHSRDAFSILISIIEAANFYLSKEKKDLFEILRDIEKEYKLHRISYKNKVTSSGKAKRFFVRIKESEKIGNKKIINKYEYFENTSNGQKQILILKLLDKSTIIIEYDTGDKILKLFVEVIGKKDQVLMDVIINERQIYNDIEEINELHTTKKLNARDFIKYSLFFIIFILIFYFLFQTIYSLNGSSGDIFNNISKLIWENKANLYIFCSLILFSFFGIAIHAISLKRMLSILGHKVRFKDLFVGSYLGIAITNITPLPGGGGDVITYWYLRRRGVDRPALYASILLGSLVYQMVIVLATAIFLPIGIVFYSEVFSVFDTSTITLIVFLAIGTIFDIFGAVMIALISINKKFQEWVVRAVIKLMEWIPFILISDPGSTASRFQYEFNEIRKGIKIISQKKRYIFEQIFYRFVPWFVSATATLGAVIFQNAGKIVPNIPAGAYFNILSGSSLVRAANSISITPGGTGTIDLFTTNIFKYIFVSPNDSAVFSLMDRIATLIIPTCVSIILIITVYLGERRVDKWNFENHNNLLTNKSSKIRRTRFYKIAGAFWLVLLVITLVIIGFI